MAYLKTLVFLIATVSMFSAGVGNEAIADPGPTTAAIKPWVYGGYVHAHWMPDGNEFWYESFGAGWKRTFWWVNAITGKSTPAFDCVRLHEALEKLQMVMFDKDFIVVNDIHRLANNQLQLDILGLRFSYNPATNELKYIAELTYAPRLLRPLALLKYYPVSNEETTITFINHKSRSVSIWWLNENGVQTRIGTVYNWQEYPAFVGNVFIVKNDEDQILGSFEAVGDPSQVSIDDLVSPATEPTKPLNGMDCSPNGYWEALLRNDNIIIRERKNGHEWPLTTDGHAGDGYSTDTSFVRWSPDSRKLFAGRTVYQGKPLLLVQSSPADQLEPKLFMPRYFRPTDIIIHEPHLFDVERRREIAIHHEPALKPNYLRWQYWNPDSKRIDFECVSRGLQTLQVISLDVSTGQTSTVIDERSNTFVDSISDEKYFRYSVPETGEYIWTSERDGWNHAYLYDAVSDKLKNQITKGNWVIRGMLSINAPARQFYFKAGGIAPKEDPYNIHICRINFDGTGLIDLTPAEGTHGISLSPDDRFYLDTYSRVDLPPITELRRSSDAGLICVVDKADLSDLRAVGWRPPERFVAKGRDGTTDIYGVIYRPIDFDPSRKYPVIEDIYAGPQTAHVPKQFMIDDRITSMANLGFIIVQIDGMGTNYRSKAFHDVCWHNLADAGFLDRILWIKAASAKNPQMDLSRVGIFGTSSGAENAVRALESHGDFYSVAVAGFGVYDDRLCGASERWMGWPVGPWYAEQSDVSDAAKIKGKLLLISGELDHVADPSSTMRMVDALIKADKDFDLLVIPNADHDQYGDYGDRRVRDFFVHNLLKK